MKVALDGSGKRWWGLALLAPWAVAMGAQDIAGSHDLTDVERFPRAWIVAFEEDAGVEPREFIISAVEKIRRELRIEQKLRIDATVQRITYEIPGGTPLQEVIEHYQRELRADALFECRGRDCGRSNGWANQVFEIATLYGPDGNQFYIAANRDGKLVSAYVIERGNRRIYAHVEALQPSRAIEAVTNAKLTERLAGDGFAVVDGVRPRRDGSLPEASVATLEALAPRLAIFERQKVFVVCHLYGPDTTPALVEHSSSCAARVIETLESAMSSGPELAPFGAGPMLPRAGSNASRVELVLPHRQQRD